MEPEILESDEVLLVRAKYNLIPKHPKSEFLKESEVALLPSNEQRAIADAQSRRAKRFEKRRKKG